ncbi:MAG: CopG family transcriptional regulator [Candidatus Diapherotrites archaeon]|nr:CopG family transcriptional regulator [Candidatus Diapherotrites archaeon]
MKSNRKEYKSVMIPKPLAEKAQELIKGTGFTSLPDFVEFLLREVLTEKHKKGQAYTEEDKKRIKERLRALGYL